MFYRRLWFAAPAAIVVMSCSSEVTRPPGILVERDPIQSPLQRPTVLSHKGFALEEVASFDVEARVLSRRDYPLRWYHYLGFVQYFEQISPMDLALGWGVMSDSALLDQLEVGQSGRFYGYRWRGNVGVSARDMGLHSSNMHLVPDGPATERKLRDIHVGDVVRIRGSLINASHPASGRFWKTSTHRRDTGGGACEIVYVTSMETVALSD